MNRLGTEAIEEEHPIHDTKTFFWKGDKQSWREADTVEQKKAL
jgi:hypothetical protein